MNNIPRNSTKPRLTSFPKLIPLLLVACLAIATGCRDEDPSRYPSVAIPGYEPKDYVTDLSHPNPEIVFNAVSVLCTEASLIRTALAKPGDTNSYLSHVTAKAAYQGVFPLLKSRDPRLVAVSLRFLQLLGPTHDGASGLIGPITQIESPHPLIQFEQVSALHVFATNTTQLPAPFLRRLLHSPHWMVSRATYQLIGKVQEQTLLAELLARYSAATEEREKLLILSAFSQTPGPKAIELFQQELLSSNKEKVRLAAAGILASNLDIPGVGAWLATSYPRLSPDARHAVIEHCVRSEAQEVSGTELIHQFLTQGYQPEKDFYSILNGLIDDAPDPLPAHLQRLDQAVRAHATLGVAWKSGRAERAEAKAHFAALQKEYPALAEELTAKAQAMFAKHKIPAEKQRHYLSSLATLDSLKP